MTVCFTCERSDQRWYYEINPEGGYGRPEAWCCHNCMKSAEHGSYVQQKRDSLYHEYFPEYPEEVDHPVYGVVISE